MISLVKRIFRTGVFWSGMFTLFRGVGFVLVLPFVLKKLPAEEVGLWYVFLSISGFCAIVDVGFAPVISRLTSYYVAGLQELPSLSNYEVKLADGVANHAGLAGLVRMAQKLYRIFAIVIFVLMLAGGGGWLLWKYPEAILRPKNAIAFLIFCAGSAWSMWGQFWMGMLFGINRVKEYQTTLLEALAMNYALVLTGIYLQFGLIALVTGIMTQAIFQRWRARGLFHRLYPVEQVEQALPIQWRHLWPMSWRGAITGFCMSFALSSTTLICAQLFDLKQTGAYGLSLQLVLMAYTLSNSWMMVKYPVMTNLRLQGKKQELRQIVFQRLALQMASYAIVCIIAWTLAPLLLSVIKTRTTFLEPRLLALLMVVVSVDLFVNAHVSIVLTANRYPLIGSLIINLGLSVILCVILGRLYGIAGMICGPMAAQMVFNGWYVMRWCWRDLYK